MPHEAVDPGGNASTPTAIQWVSLLKFFRGEYRNDQSGLVPRPSPVGHEIMANVSKFRAHVLRVSVDHAWGRLCSQKSI